MAETPAIEKSLFIFSPRFPRVAAKDGQSGEGTTEEN
jgi:hypothetical protein